MRLVLFSLAASLAVATPVMAQSSAKDTASDMGARVDIHTGLGWADSGKANATLGATAGYDIATGGGTFAGLEESVDKVLTSQDKVRFGTTVRFGTHVTPADKLYALAGYSYGTGPNGTHVGAGVEHSFGPVFGKVEYRHTFNEDAVKDSNATLVGVGMHF